MTPRLNPFNAAPDMMQAMLNLEEAVRHSGLEHSLIDLVKTRASQINGCAYCIHMHTRDARAKREQYVGSWLPEPLIDGAEEQRDDVTFMLMLALERLSPLERAAFLLHDVFGLDFKAVAEAVGRDVAACRQLAARARRHVREARPRFPMPPERSRDIAAAFFDASRRGDLQMLQRILAADVVAYTDGGGKVLAAIKPIYGQAKVMRMFAGLARRAGQAKPPLLYQGIVNSMAGFVTLEPQNVLQSTSFDIENGRIVAVYIVRNPDKLRHMRVLLDQ